MLIGEEHPPSAITEMDCRQSQLPALSLMHCDRVSAERAGSAFGGEAQGRIDPLRTSRLDPNSRA